MSATEQQLPGNLTDVLFEMYWRKIADAERAFEDARNYGVLVDKAVASAHEHQDFARQITDLLGYVPPKLEVAEATA